MISRERLERILKLRASSEAGAKGDWARARMKGAGVRAEAEGCAARRDEATAEVRSRAQGTVNPLHLQRASDVREAMGRDVARAEAAARQSEAETEARRRRLEAAHRAARAIRNLVERSRAADEAIARAAEARERDDRGRRELA